MNRTRKLLVTTAMSMPFFAGSVAAQEAADAPSGGLADIVVTAQKRSENLQDVPIAVTALSATNLNTANITGPTALPRITPNLVVTVNSVFATPYIRGVGSQYANSGLENSVSVYLDDLYVPRSTSGFFEFNDVERIEVLKGPQGTLYGRNATGGAIRIITADPKPDFEATARVTYGTDDRLKLEGMINVPLGEGISARFSAQRDRDDGYITNLNPNGKQHLFNRHQDVYRGKLLFEPTDELTIKISGDYLRDKGTIGLGNQNLYPGLPEQIGAPGGLATGFYTVNNDYPFSGTNLKVGGIALRIDYDFGPVTLSSVTGYRKETNGSLVDLDSTGANVLNAASYDQRTRQYTEELQLTSNGGGSLSYVAGLFFLDETSLHGFAIWGDSTGGAALGGIGQSHTRSIAPFAQVDYAVSDMFKVTAGLRYTQENKQLDFNRGFFGTPSTNSSGFPTNLVFGPVCSMPGQIGCDSPDRELNFSKLTPKLTLSFTPADHILLYVTASRGFKSGGLNLPTFGAVDTVRPETLDALEFGWKTQFSSLRFNGAAFYYDSKDLQVQITDQTTGGSRTVNAATAEIYGIETDITWVPVDHLEIGVGGGYLHAAYKDYVGVANIPCTEIPTNPTCVGQGGLGLAPTSLDFSGNRIPNSPRWNGYIRAQYEIPLGNGMGTITPSGIYSYRTGVVFDDAGRHPQDSYGLLSARLTWMSEDEKFSLSVFGDNLTAEKYVTFKSPSNNGGWKYPGPPRQIYVQAAVRF